uniref:Uncharacterized protein n=1 Tax=Arundo donax TaxID=35708 RepID=A0A0A9C8H2_ARUDO
MIPALLAEHFKEQSIPLKGNYLSTCLKHMKKIKFNKWPICVNFKNSSGLVSKPLQ